MAFKIFAIFVVFLMQKLVRITLLWTKHEKVISKVPFQWIQSFENLYRRLFQ